jgi:cytochrome P450
VTVFLAQEERLWIADPKAIGHILKNSNTLYGKLDSMREFVALVIDRGLVWADGSAFSNSAPFRVLTSTGDAHKRQRRAMTPAFGLVESKGLLPYFAQSATKVGSHLLSIQRCDR